MLRRFLAYLLRPFTRVHPEEAVTATLMTFAAFLLLTAYYLLKTVREPLILLQGGAEVKLYARAAQAIAMVGFVHFYGELARRVGRFRLLTFVFLFFISNLVVFAILARTNLRIGLPFFLWVGVFSYTIVAQFWGLAADIYTDEQGKRLFPIIGAGSSIGAVVGARFAKALVPFGPSSLMGAAVALLLVCVTIVVWIERRAMASHQVKPDDPHPDEPLADKGAFHLLAKDKYLLLIAGMAIFLNWVNSSGEYLLDRTLLTTTPPHGMAQQAFVGAFKADYFAWYNLLGVLFELFIVSRVLRVVGVRKALYFMPIFAFGAYASAAALPVLAILRLVKIGENSLQYSLQDTTRHALFLVASRTEKFVGKTAVDTIAVRLGAVMSAVMVIVGTRFAWSVRRFAMIDVGLTVVWMVFVVLIGREHKARSDERSVGVARGEHGEPTVAGA